MGAGKVFEASWLKFSQTGENINLKIQVSQQIQRINANKATPRNIIVKLLKFKDTEKVLKAA